MSIIKKFDTETKLTFEVMPPLYLPFYNRWGQNAYYTYDPFDYDPLNIRAVSTSGSPVILVGNKFFGFMNETGGRFAYDGKYTLTVTCPAGQPEAVLIRSAKAIEGMEQMQELRRSKKGSIPKEKDLLTGPGKLCIAMNISRQHYGESLRGDKLYLAEGVDVPDDNIKCSPRINVDYAEEDALLPYRFCDVGTGHLSAKA